MSPLSENKLALYSKDINETNFIQLTDISPYILPCGCPLFKTSYGSVDYKRTQKTEININSASATTEWLTNNE